MRRISEPRVGWETFLARIWLASMVGATALVFCVVVFAWVQSESVHAMVARAYHEDSQDDSAWLCDIVLPRDLDADGSATVDCDPGVREGDFLSLHWDPIVGFARHGKTGNGVPDDGGSPLMVSLFALWTFLFLLPLAGFLLREHFWPWVSRVAVGRDRHGHGETEIAPPTTPDAVAAPTQNLGGEIGE